MIRTKKILAAFAACLMMMLPLSMTVFAELNNTDLPRVVDEEMLLDDGQIESLENKISDITKKYDFDVVIYTTYSIEGKNAQDFADAFYDKSGYGTGKKNDGIILLVSTEFNDGGIAANGYGEKVFSDEKCNDIAGKIAGYLHNGDYNAGFNEFLTQVESELSGYKPKMILISLGIGFGIGLVVAVIVVLVLRGQLKSVALQKSAANYEVPGSMNVTRSHDMFLYKQVTKTRKESSDSSGSSSSSSSGTSFKF